MSNPAELAEDSPSCWDIFCGTKPKQPRSHELHNHTVAVETSKRGSYPISEADLQQKFTEAFEKLELSFVDLDKDLTGEIDIETVLLVLRCRGFRQEVPLMPPLLRYPISPSCPDSPAPRRKVTC